MRLRRAIKIGLVFVFPLSLSLLFFSPMQVYGSTISVTNTNDSGAGSLRQAILTANSTPELDTITFNIGAGGLKTIKPLTQFPEITAPVIIDGTTQPGYTNSPLIELDGSIPTAAGTTTGFSITAGNSTLRGLIINRFSQPVMIYAGGNNHIEGCFIGMNATGTAPVGTPDYGIRIEDSSNNVIGGLTSAQRNVIKALTIASFAAEGMSAAGNVVQGNYIGVAVDGSTRLNSGIGLLIGGAANNVVGGTEVGARNVISGSQTGIAIWGTTGSNNRIQGNYIGTDATGMAAVINVDIGIEIDAGADNVIGSADPAGRNVISGSGWGIYLHTTAKRTVIQGNYIGTNAAGTAYIPNGFGISMNRSQDNLIGGTTSGAGNLIAGNNNHGIYIETSDSTGIRILMNSIFNNGLLGIERVDVAENVVILTSVSGTTTATHVEGIVNAKPAQVQTVRIEFFSNVACDYIGYGEGEQYIGFLDVVTDSLGIANFAGDVQPTMKKIVTATATSSIGTSRFSQCHPKTHTDTIGIFRQSDATFYLRNENSTGFADSSLTFGAATDFPITGDWNGDGIDTPGVYRKSTGEFFLTDSTSTPAVLHYSFVLGIPNDQPIVGDWDADGKDGVGVFRPSNGLIYLKSDLTTGFAQYTMVLGIPGDVGIAGDWNGDGKDSPGVYRPSNQQFYLTNSVCNCPVFGDAQLGLGIAGDTPFAGDWDNDGKSGVGVYRQSNGLTYIKNALTTGFADASFVFGSASDYPLAGYWVRIAPPPPETAPPFVPQRQR
ncbi:MAG: hypothetical protein KF716_20525 [Anaerolineae bacterium]|nr:hypothetical protein [Anaerolineae bacterium]